MKYAIKYYELYLAGFEEEGSKQPVWSPNEEECRLYGTREAAQAVVDAYKDTDKAMNSEGVSIVPVR